jgi:arylformamidase
MTSSNTPRNYVDLTMAIHENMPTNRPDHFAPSVDEYSDINVNGWRGTKLTLDSHCGTHLDAPSHFVAEGATVEAVELDCLIGRCQIIDYPVSTYDAPIEVEHLPTITQSRVFFRTGWSDRMESDPEGYFHHHAFLTSSTALALVRAGVRLVGIDCPSVDIVGDDAHQTLLQHNMVIIENLVNLSSLPDECEVIILPLPIVSGDGSPVRAVAVLEDSPQ